MTKRQRQANNALAGAAMQFGRDPSNHHFAKLQDMAWEFVTAHRKRAGWIRWIRTIVGMESTP